MKGYIFRRHNEELGRGNQMCSRICDFEESMFDLFVLDCSTNWGTPCKKTALAKNAILI